VARTAHSPSSSGGTSHNSRPLCRNVDESIAELRQIADGGNDILAEAAGITAGSWYASPATHRRLIHAEHSPQHPRWSEAKYLGWSR
jgi:hypothetical protein